jgi:2-phospho-L-lactate guanylyltransferase
MIGVVIPAKPLDTALVRLSGVLDPSERRDLQAAMLEDVLAAAAGLTERIIVVSADRDVGVLAEPFGAQVVPDHVPAAGINAAVTRGVAAMNGVGVVLVVMGDLPCATTDDLRMVTAAATGGRNVVLAVSGDGTGTNAMLLTPPTVIDPSFGDGSLARHLERAGRTGVEATLVTAPGLMLDIDTADDLDTLDRSDVTSRAARLVRELNLATRTPVAPA